jgi:putative ABC transport system permease protein
MALVVRQGTKLAFIGLALGLGAGAALTKYLQTFLFEIGPRDPAALSIVVATLVAVAVAACAIPAWRAVRIDPAQALRND